MLQRSSLCVNYTINFVFMIRIDDVMGTPSYVWKNIDYNLGLGTYVPCGSTP